MTNDAVGSSSGTHGGTSPVPAGQEGGAVAERVGPSPLQVARGAGGLGLAWGGAWAGIGGAVGLAATLFTDLPMNVLASVAQYGIWGFLSGAVFALVLTTMERKGSLEDLSYLRMSLWGALGGFTVGVVMLLILGVASVIGLGGVVLQALRSAVLGAFSASATTWLAKAGTGEDHGVPGGHDPDGAT